MKVFLFLICVFSISLFGQNKYQVKKELVVKPEKNKPGLVNYSLMEGENVLFTIGKTVDFDIPFYNPAVFSDGSLMLLGSVTRDIEIYSVKGILKKRIELGEFSADYEIPLFYSVDGTEAYVVLPDQSHKINRNMVINSSGKVMGSFDTPFQQINGIAYSASRKTAVVSKISWQGVKPLKEMIFYNPKGEVTDIIAGAFFKGVFTEAGFWALDKKSLMMVTANGIVEFEDKISTDKVYLDIIAADDDVYIVSSGSPEFRNGEFVSDRLEIVMFEGVSKSGSVVLDRQVAFDRIEFAQLKPVVVAKNGVRIPVSFINQDTGS